MMKDSIGQREIAGDQVEYCVDAPHSFGIENYACDKVDEVKYQLHQSDDMPTLKKIYSLLDGFSSEEIKSVQYSLAIEEGYQSLGSTGIGEKGIDGDAGERTISGLLGYWMFNSYLPRKRMLAYTNENKSAIHNEYQKWNGPRMKGLQDFLNNNGFSVGKVDTYFGKNTYAGMLGFAEFHGIQVEKKNEQKDIKDKLRHEMESIAPIASLEPKELLSEENNAIELGFSNILGGYYDTVKDDMKSFVSNFGLSKNEIMRLCRLRRGENFTFKTNRKHYTSIGQVGKDAWPVAFSHLGMPVPEYNTNDHYNAMIASYGYAKYCGILSATNNLALGKSLMKYNLGSYTTSALNLLYNQAPDLRKEVAKQVGLYKYDDAGNIILDTYGNYTYDIDRNNIKEYVKQGVITKQDTAIGAQKYYMPKGINDFV